LLPRITALFAGVPVSDLDAGIDWYTRFFGQPPTVRVGDEVLWDIDEHATLFIEPDAERAGPPREDPGSGRQRDRVRRAAAVVDGLSPLLTPRYARWASQDPLDACLPWRKPRRAGLCRSTPRVGAHRRDSAATVGSR
jgi:catechol 2,3-dioxygenase-like lactoylglutathione lyase family enzyme